MTGVEPARLSAQSPQDCVATSYTTSTWCWLMVDATRPAPASIRELTPGSTNKAEKREENEFRYASAAPRTRFPLLGLAPALRLNPAHDYVLGGILLSNTPARTPHDQQSRITALRSRSTPRVLVYCELLWFPCARDRLLARTSGGIRTHKPYILSAGGMPVPVTLACFSFRSTWPSASGSSDIKVEGSQFCYLY